MVLVPTPNLKAGFRHGVISRKSLLSIVPCVPVAFNFILHQVFVYVFFIAEILELLKLSLSHHYLHH